MKNFVPFKALGPKNWFLYQLRIFADERWIRRSGHAKISIDLPTNYRAR